mgnify:CR=1 FL=1|tara:strand:+ start:269 stop:1177 length:909 start_codon:yes stop_codon:yes gene_type:complete
MRKGIILAGGRGTRLAPLTNVISKQLMPVFDKPMIYYPLGTLMLSGIKEYLIITTPLDHELYRALLGDGQQWGIQLSYKIQSSPEGIAQAFIIGEEFIGNSEVAFILGDNLFHGNQLIPKLQDADKIKKGATLFAYKVNDPTRYGVVELDESGKVLSIEEKPEKPKSRNAVTGLYFYDNKVVNYAKSLNFSKRNELEITDINKIYLKEGNLNVQLIGRGNAWLDTGTIESLHEASSYIRTLENRQGLKISCPEEIAWRNKWINDEQLEELARPIAKSGYGMYLMNLLNETESEKILYGSKLL